MYGECRKLLQWYHMTHWVDSIEVLGKWNALWDCVKYCMVNVENLQWYHMTHWVDSIEVLGKWNALWDCVKYCMVNVENCYSNITWLIWWQYRSVGKVKCIMGLCGMCMMKCACYQESALAL